MEDELAQLRAGEATGRKERGNLPLGGLDLTVPQGSISGFLGRNSAGEATIRIPMGLAKADHGSARIFGIPPGDGNSGQRPGRASAPWIPTFGPPERGVVYFVTGRGVASPWVIPKPHLTASIHIF